MTNREFLTVVAGLETVSAEVRAHATAELQKMDAANAKRREKTAEKSALKQAEKAPIRDALFAALTDEFQTATSLIAAAGLDIKPQSVPSLFKALCAEGKIEKGEVKVRGKGKQRGYKVAAAE